MSVNLVTGAISIEAVPVTALQTANHVTLTAPAYPTVSNYARSYVRARAEVHMNCTVTIYAKSTNEFDVNTGLVTSGFAAEIYEGKARVYSIDGGGTLNLGEALISTKTTYCSIPWDTPYVAVDSVVVINDMPGDVENESTTWRVISVDGGGLMRATRRLQIVAWTSSADWEE